LKKTPSVPPPSQSLALTQEQEAQNEQNEQNDQKDQKDQKDGDNDHEELKEYEKKGEDDDKNDNDNEDKDKNKDKDNEDENENEDKEQEEPKTLLSNKIRTATRKTAFKVTGDKDDELLTAVQKKRMKFIRKKQKTKSREAETLAKLALFAESIKKGSDSKKMPKKEMDKQAKTTAAKTPTTTKTTTTTTTATSMTSTTQNEGKLGIQDKPSEEDGSDEGWQSHQVKFMKRPQDFDLMQRNTEDYEYSYFDPKKHKGLARNAKLKRQLNESTTKSVVKSGGGIGYKFNNEDDEDEDAGKNGLEQEQEILLKLDEMEKNMERGKKDSDTNDTDPADDDDASDRAKRRKI